MLHFLFSTANCNRKLLPLFGLTELGSVFIQKPKNPSLEAAVGGNKVVYAQHYTPTVKALEERVPLAGRPNLLTYLLGTGFVSSTSRFAKVWDEVNKERTRLELEEVADPCLPIDARFEIVMTDDNPSFLSSICHRKVARLLVVDRLLVKVSSVLRIIIIIPVKPFNPTQVPIGQFPGYVRSMVRELYGTIRAALHGTLTGGGTLGSVLLCESLLSYLATGHEKHQPTNLLKAYSVLPRTVHERSRRVDLSQYARIRGGVLYIPQPALESIWVPLGALPSSARATAKQLLQFLHTLRDYGDLGLRHPRMVERAADIIVLRFKRDLVDTGAVTDTRRLDGDIQDGCIKDVLTAEQYIDRVFVPSHLPEDMSFRNLLSMSMELMDPNQLRCNLITKLLERVKVVPRTTVHARSVNFSTSQYTLLLGGQLSSPYLTGDDAHRLVIASAPLLEDLFQMYKKERKLVLARRPCLIRCVRGAAEFVRRRTRSTRHLLAVTCFAAIMLAEKEHLLHTKVEWKRLYHATNISRFILKRDMDIIVRRCMAGEEYGLPECRLVLDRLVVHRRS